MSLGTERTPAESGTAYSEDQLIGFRPRFGAILIDYVLLSIMTSVLGAMAPQSMEGWALSLVICAAYFIYFWSTSGVTIGNRVLNIRVAKADGSALNLSTGMGRFIGFFISSWVLYLGVLSVLWDPKKQGWHDKIAKTVVIRGVIGGSRISTESRSASTRFPEPGSRLWSYIVKGNRPGLRVMAARIGQPGELPHWPISDAILATASELLELRASGPIVTRVGVPSSVVELLSEDAERVAHVLADITKRVVAAAEQRLDPQRIEPALLLETNRLDTIHQSVAGLRNQLGALTLSGPSDDEVQEVVSRLRQINELAGEVNRLTAD